MRLPDGHPDLLVCGSLFPHPEHCLILLLCPARRAVAVPGDLSRFAELLGEVLTDSTEKNLKMRADAEAGACEGKFDLAKRAKAAGLDAIHDTVHEMAKDEARHGAGFKGLLKRYFG